MIPATYYSEDIATSETKKASRVIIRDDYFDFCKFRKIENESLRCLHLGGNNGNTPFESVLAEKIPQMSFLRCDESPLSETDSQSLIEKYDMVVKMPDGRNEDKVKTFMNLCHNELGNRKYSVCFDSLNVFKLSHYLWDIFFFDTCGEVNPDVVFNLKEKIFPQLQKGSKKVVYGNFKLFSRNKVGYSSYADALRGDLNSPKITVRNNGCEEYLKTQSGRILNHLQDLFPEVKVELLHAYMNGNKKKYSDDRKDTSPMAIFRFTAKDNKHSVDNTKIFDILTLSAKQIMKTKTPTQKPRTAARYMELRKRFSHAQIAVFWAESSKMQMAAFKAHATRKGLL